MVSEEVALMLVLCIASLWAMTLDDKIAVADNVEQPNVNPNGHKQNIHPSGSNGGTLDELDIMVDPSQKLGFGQRRKRHAVKFYEQLWAGGKVPYEISSSFSASQKSTIESAISDFNKISCVKWVKRTNQANYVHIGDYGGCWSYVGCVKKGRQNFSLKRPTSTSPGTCFKKDIILHEMGHAVGLYHEHNRSDRGKYVSINTGNVKSDATSQFKISENATTLGAPYDYTSLMHYGRDAFSKNGKDTIVTKDASKESVIGESNGFSKIDKIILNHIYRCSG